MLTSVYGCKLITGGCERGEFLLEALLLVETDIEFEKSIVSNSYFFDSIRKILLNDVGSWNKISTVISVPQKRVTVVVIGYMGWYVPYGHM